MPSWVYEIIETHTDKIVYIGSTTGKYFCLRKGEHMRPSTLSSGRQPMLYNYIKDSGGWDKFKFNIIEYFDNIEKVKLLSLEKQYIAEKNPLANSIKPIETREEYLQRKRLQLRKWRKEHPEYLITNKNRQSQIEYTKKRCSTKINCECGGSYTLQNKTNHFSRNIHKEYENKKVKTEINPEITSS
jgi:hypothetical protein